LDCAKAIVMAAVAPINIIAMPHARRMFLVFIMVLCLLEILKMVIQNL